MRCSQRTPLAIGLQDHTGGAGPDEDIWGYRRGDNSSYVRFLNSDEESSRRQGLLDVCGLARELARLIHERPPVLRGGAKGVTRAKVEI